MTVIDRSAVDELEAFSRPVIVVLRSKGIVFPSNTRRDALSVGQLMVLERLAAGSGTREEAVAWAASRSQADPAELRSLLDGLHDDGLLVAAPDRARAGATEETFLGARPYVGAEALPGQLTASAPVLFRLTPNGFEALDHDGNSRMHLSGVELGALSAFGKATELAAAHGEQQRRLGAVALDDVGFEAFVRQCLAVGLLADASPGTAAEKSDSKAQRMIRRLLLQQRDTRQAADRMIAEHEAEVAGLGLTRVVPVDSLASQPPLAIGMLVAHAVAHGGPAVEEHFDLFPNWAYSVERIKALSDRPGLFLFSNYVWSHERNLASSADVKAANPHHVTVHGGPDTPRYEGDEQRYFEQNPHVDITVRGEGEATFTEVLKALAGQFGDGPTDLSPLRDVAGVTFRLGDEVVRTPDRDRITDLDDIPSPFLTGYFDAFAGASGTDATIETNRGCPYGCTYCDWGSATLSRIRKFSLDRVFAELEWCAQHEVASVWVADANFGIFERDVEIAQKVADLKREYGYPRIFTTNYAKNTIKHLQKIVEVMAEADILTNGLLSLQSMDQGTLLTIRRSNIKTEKYEELSREFRRADLPLFVDIMLGLPGSTREAFGNDLQECIGREVYAKIFPTELLVNSPMNDPEYRAEHQIVTQAPGEIDGTLADGTRRFTDRPLVVSTATFTREDFSDMMDLRRVFFLCENFGALRQLSRHVRHQVGITEIQLYERLRASAAHPDQWPYISLTMQNIPDLMVPPVSWRLFIDEMGRYVVDELGVADDSALRTALRVQHALLPERDRVFPCTLHLDHDYAAWHRLMVEAKDAGHHDDWPDFVPALSTFGPATFVVNDPYAVCERARGFRVDLEYNADWELDSPVARAMPHGQRDAAL